MLFAFQKEIWTVPPQFAFLEIIDLREPSWYVSQVLISWNVSPFVLFRLVLDFTYSIRDKRFSRLKTATLSSISNW